MSKYVILIKFNKTSPFLHNLGQDYFCMYFHTRTKLKDNEPYWSADLTQGDFYSISKEDLPAKLKQAQNTLQSRGKQPIRAGKRGKIFVLKLGSSKLKGSIC